MMSSKEEKPKPVPDWLPDFPKVQHKHVERGFIPAMKFLYVRRKEALTSISRLMCMVYTLQYIDFFFQSTKGEPTVCYVKALLANAVTSLIRLYYRITHIEFSKEFVSRLLTEDSFHYLLYSLIFLYDYSLWPLTFTALAPLCLSSFLHVSGFLLSFFYVLGFHWPPLISVLTKIVRHRAISILRYVGTLEIVVMLMIVVILPINRLLGLWCALSTRYYSVHLHPPDCNKMLMNMRKSSSMFTPYFYYKFLEIRYYKGNNPYSRTLIDSMHDAFAPEFRTMHHHLTAFAMKINSLIGFLFP